MLQKIKRKIRIYRIKREARGPRVHTATMEDIQRKLQDYVPPAQKTSPTL